MRRHGISRRGLIKDTRLMIRRTLHRACSLRRPGIAAVAFCLVLFSPDPARSAQSMTGQAAPDFALRTLESQNIRLSEFRGEVVLINFWATWCGACQQELTALDDLYAKYNRAGLVMLGVNIDDDAGRAAEMVRKLKVSFPVLMDEHKEVARLYQLQDMPVTLLVDREGVVRVWYDNYKPGHEKQYLERVRELLKE